MATVIGSNQIRLNNGQVVSAQNGGWYDGQQFWNGQLGPVNVIINPEQTGAGQHVSSEVRAQSAAQQGVTPEQFDQYLLSQMTGGNAPGGAGVTSGQLDQYLSSQKASESTIPEFAFDWTAAEKAALAKLTPYYQAKLKEAQFDVDRAKRLIEEDYARGERTRTEDLATSQREWATTEPRELENLLTSLNQRGRLVGEITEPSVSAAPLSGYAQQEKGTLEETQSLRRLAVERALQRQSELAGVERSRGIEEQDIAFPRYQKALEEEKKEKAVLQMAPLQYEQEYNKWLATVGRYVNT